MGNLAVGPGGLVELPEKGELGYESTKAPIEEILEAIDKLLKWACVSNGLSAGSMSTEPTEQSGISKIVDNKELSEIRQDDIALFRVYEHRLFDMFRIVWNAHNKGRMLSDKAELKINFYDPQPQLSPTEQCYGRRS